MLCFSFVFLALVATLHLVVAGSTNTHGFGNLAERARPRYEESSPDSFDNYVSAYTEEHDSEVEHSISDQLEAPEYIETDIIPPENFKNLEVYGADDRPAQILFKKIFPLKKVQLDLTMKYGNDIDKIAEKANTFDGNLYNTVTRELKNLYPEAEKVDELTSIYWQKERKYVPQLTKFTALYNAPHFTVGSYRHFDGNVAQFAAIEANNLKAVAEALRLQLA